MMSETPIMVTLNKKSEKRYLIMHVVFDWVVIKSCLSPFWFEDGVIYGGLWGRSTRGTSRKREKSGWWLGTERGGGGGGDKGVWGGGVEGEGKRGGWRWRWIWLNAFTIVIKISHGKVIDNEVDHMENSLTLRRYTMFSIKVLSDVFFFFWRGYWE